MISIVIPALNESKLLPGCLQSLQNQDYAGEYEIIVVDNGSTDDTADIARSFGVRVIPCPDKRSVIYARQAGADVAGGDIIIQADADTVYPERWLKRIADRLAAQPEAVAISGRYFYRDAFFWAKVEYAVRYGINRITAALFGRPILISGATFAFRRNAFLSLNGYRGLSFSADQYGISGRLRQLGKVLYDRNLYVFTSARRVQKPTIELIGDIIANLGRWVAYIGQSNLSGLQQSLTRTPARRALIRFAPLPVLMFSLVLVVPRRKRSPGKLSRDAA